MIMIGYWDLSKPEKHGYQRCENRVNQMMLRENIFPGAYGFPDLYIRHIRFVHGREPVLIITQTERELEEGDRTAIVRGAIAFLNHPPDESSPDA
ncbi:hypothetical protein [Egbenema bharatensis]|uniref:hypothetical protein n=1 Tax=Egbenema bharatensis TaxID=3463334 RepID=UPI003A8B4AB4